MESYIIITKLMIAFPRHTPAEQKNDADAALTSRSRFSGLVLATAVTPIPPFTAVVEPRFQMTELAVADNVSVGTVLNEFPLNTNKSCR